MRKHFKFSYFPLFMLLSLPLCLAGCGGGSPLPPAAEEEKPQPAPPAAVDFAFTKEYFSGKYAVVYGDSNTYAHGSSQPGPQSQTSWIYHLSERLGFTYKSYATNGALLTYQEAKRVERDSVCEEIEQNAAENAKADVAFFLIGCNDYRRGVPVGGEEDPQTLEEVSTYRGGLRRSVKKLREQNAGIEIVFLSPIYYGDSDCSGMVSYRDAIAELSTELGYRWIDCTTAFSAIDLAWNYAADKLHLNDAGEVALAEYVYYYGLNQNW